MGTSGVLPPFSYFTPDGTVVGKHKPSSEYPFHKAIYNMRPHMKAVIHAHPPALVSFSIAHQIPNTNMNFPIAMMTAPITTEWRLPIKRSAR